VTLRLWIARFVIAVVVSGCGDDALPTDAEVPLDGGADTSPEAGPVISHYDGDRPPRDGFCEDEGGARPLDALPITIVVDARDTLVDHARPSTACTVSSASVAPDVVFSFVPPELGIFTMRADLPGTDPWVDTVLYVRSECGEGGEELACNDDSSMTSGPSRLSLEVPGGAVIYPVVDGFGDDDAGPVEVTFDFVPMPVASDPGADTCAAATELRFSGTGDTRIAIAMGDTEGRSSDAGCDGVPSTHDLPDQFYAFTLDDTRDVLIEVSPDSEYDPAFYVLRACGDPDPLACHDTGPPGFTEALTLEAVPPGRYIIGVDAFEHPERVEYESGTYVLEVVATVP
jgi:hypothetical protein